MTVPVVHRMWNEAATKRAIDECRQFSLWPEDTTGWSRFRRSPLIVHTGPSGHVNTGGHTS